jgi:ribosomal protein S27E
MRHAEFKDKLKQFQKNNQRNGLCVFLPGFIICCFGMMPFLIFYKKMEALAASSREIVIVGVSTFAALGVFAASTFIFVNRTKKLTKDLGLECPECGKSLTALYSHVVMAAGRCGNCGAVIIPELTCQHKDA